MSVGHYENFPVASVLLPQALRRPVALIYRFARSADDFADEGDLQPQQRLALLAGYRAELRRLEAGGCAQSPLFRELGEVVAVHRLPFAPRLRGGVGLEIRAVVQGGLRVLEKLERQRGNVFRRRPVLRAWDWPLMLARALAMR